MRWPAIALAFGVMLVPTAASACGNLNAYGRQLQAERQERYLDGTREIDGRWQLEDQREDGYRAGSIHLRRGGHETGRTFHAYFGDELNCGFPIFPQDAEAGHFYLRRNGSDSWRIIHFESDETRAALAREETRP